MAQLLSETLSVQSKEFQQRIFSTTLPQSVDQWRRLSTTGMLDCFPVGVALLDEHLVLTYQNSAYAEYLDNFYVGASQRAKGRCFFDYLPGSQDWTESSFRYVKDFKTTLIEHDHEIWLKDGQAERQTFWNGNLAALIRSDKSLAGVVLVCQDTSMEKLMMNHLVKLERQFQELAQQLEDSKKAIRFLTDMRIEDQRRMQENLSDSMTSVVFPLLELIKKCSLKASQKNALDVVCTTLADLTGDMMRPSQPPSPAFTPKENQIFKMIKAGRTTKEMAEIMCVSAAAISFHRSNIRKKFGHLRAPRRKSKNSQPGIRPLLSND